MGPLLSAPFTPPGIHVLTTGNLHIRGLAWAVVYQGAQQLWGGAAVLLERSASPDRRKIAIPWLRPNSLHVSTAFVCLCNNNVFVCALKTLIRRFRLTKTRKHEIVSTHCDCVWSAGLLHASDVSGKDQNTELPGVTTPPRIVTCVFTAASREGWWEAHDVTFENVLPLWYLGSLRRQCSKWKWCMHNDINVENKQYYRWWWVLLK